MLQLGRTSVTIRKPAHVPLMRCLASVKTPSSRTGSGALPRYGRILETSPGFCVHTSRSPGPRATPNHLGI